VISTDGFTRFDFLETEFTLPDEAKFIFADDFSIAGDIMLPVIGHMDCDVDADFDDIDDFVAILTASDSVVAQTVPEPGRAGLFYAALGLSAFWRRRSD
jgi:hypothetical protein